MSDEEWLRPYVFQNRDKIAEIDKDMAVQKVLRDRAPAQVDLDKLETKLERKMDSAISGVRHDIQSVRAEIGTSNEQWAEKILTGARTLNAEAQLQRMDEQKQFRRQVGFMVFSAVLSILAALVVFWMTAGRP